MPEYAKRDARSLAPHYWKHVSAMTTEALHSKADIAAELAFRDARIAELETELAAAESRLETYRRTMAEAGKLPDVVNPSADELNEEKQELYDADMHADDEQNGDDV